MSSFRAVVGRDANVEPPWMDLRRVLKEDTSLLAWHNGGKIHVLAALFIVGILALLPRVCIGQKIISQQWLATHPVYSNIHRS